MSSYDWTSLNKTELAAIAREFHPEAHRGLPFDVLVRIIESFDAELPMRTVNKKRLDVMTHVNNHWESVSPLVRCPAQSREARACFGCSDTQVACCVLENAKLFFNDD